MPQRNARDLLKYAQVLVEGRALNVRRLAEYVDYDEEILEKAIARWNRVPEAYSGWQPYEHHTPGDWPTWNGINIALTRALADANDRSYRRRQKSR